MVKNLPVNVGDMGFICGLGRFPWRRKWQPTSVFLLGKSHRGACLAGYSPWGQSDITEHVCIHSMQEHMD